MAPRARATRRHQHHHAPPMRRAARSQTSRAGSDAWTPSDNLPKADVFDGARRYEALPWRARRNNNEGPLLDEYILWFCHAAQKDSSQNAEWHLSKYVELNSKCPAQRVAAGRAGRDTAERTVSAVFSLFEAFNLIGRCRPLETYRWILGRIATLCVYDSRFVDENPCMIEIDRAGIGAFCLGIGAQSSSQPVFPKIWGRLVPPH